MDVGNLEYSGKETLYLKENNSSRVEESEKFTLLLLLTNIYFISLVPQESVPAKIPLVITTEQENP